MNVQIRKHLIPSWIEWNSLRTPVYNHIIKCGAYAIQSFTYSKICCWLNDKLITHCSKVFLILHLFSTFQYGKVFASFAYILNEKRQASKKYWYIHYHLIIFHFCSVKWMRDNIITLSWSNYFELTTISCKCYSFWSYAFHVSVMSTFWPS